MRRKADEPRAVAHHPQRNLKARLAKLLRERRHVLARFAEGDDAAGISLRRVGVHYLIALGQEPRHESPPLSQKIVGDIVQPNCVEQFQRGVVADEYRAPEGSYLAGEVALMGVTGERDEERMLVFPLWSARRRATEYLIFRAYDLAAGPLATLPVPCECPLAFHGCFNYRS